MPMRTGWPAISAREFIDLEARTHAVLVTIRKLPLGEMRSRALAEATALHVRAEVLCRIAIGSSQLAAGLQSPSSLHSAAALPARSLEH